MITLNTNPGPFRWTAVYERILSDLQQGAIAPGETISLNKLAETLNISKTPLRDALLELQAEGFVTLYPQRGVMVNALSEEEKREIYEVCGVLDGQVIRNVFPRRNAGARCPPEGSQRPDVPRHPGHFQRRVQPHQSGLP